VIVDRVVGDGNWKGERSEGEGELRSEWQAKGTKMISKASFYTLGNWWSDAETELGKFWSTEENFCNGNQIYDMDIWYI